MLAVEAAAIFAVVADATSLGDALLAFSERSAILQPALLLTVLVLCAASPWLGRLDYPRGLAAVFALGALVPVLVSYLFVWLFPLPDLLTPLQCLLFSVPASALLTGYFHLRGKALSPAVTEARLQALQARIRPHFLFNSLNAVLSLVRSDPRRAEHALEDLSELFRALMRENRDLVPLQDEIELTRAYLGLEQLRLGDRLSVEWHIEKMPGDALIPPLVIQPLVENAVYHGIEPQREPGRISLNIYRSGETVHIVIRNPYAASGSHHAGNKLALNNIRERLALHFDLDATLKSELLGAVYQVHINLPYTRATRHGFPPAPARRG